MKPATGDLTPPRGMDATMPLSYHRQGDKINVDGRLFSPQMTAIIAVNLLQLAMEGQRLTGIRLIPEHESPAVPLSSVAPVPAPAGQLPAPPHTE